LSSLSSADGGRTAMPRHRRTEPACVDIDTFRNPARRALASPADSWGWQVHPRHDRMENLAQSITQKRTGPRTENVFKDRRPINTKTKANKPKC
jgi:hypothetical protein